MKLRFRGSRALIAGGSCEIALRLAELLIGEGLRPVSTWRSEAGRLKIEDRLRPFEGRYETARIDFAERGSMDALFSGSGGSFDYFADFAQGDFESLVGAADPERVHGYFSQFVSFRAELLKRVSRTMLRKKHGRLVFISSAAAGRSNPGQGFYAAAKLASEALYRNLAIELSGRGITAVTLRPGYVNAGRGAQYLESRGEAAESAPLRRPLGPDEVAEAVVFLLSDNAVGFNATELCMDGGLTAVK